MSKENTETVRNEQSTEKSKADAVLPSTTTDQNAFSAKLDGGDLDDYEDFGSGDLSDRRHRDWSQSASGNGYDNAMTD